LLFSLLEINPPPFCLHDEADAALDGSNVTLFCDILKRLAQRTQFIVITHNRVTMTSAQVIYGVFMGSDSISRLLSLKLEEAPVAGDRSWLLTHCGLPSWTGRSCSRFQRPLFR
jgi:chromosome segregation protein